mgnify:CR=1 FL=1
MINAFSIVGAIALVLGLALVVRILGRALVEWVRGMRVRRERRKLPEHLRIPDRPRERAGAGEVLLGAILVLLGVPLVWVGWALGSPYTAIDPPARLAQIGVGPGQELRIETTGGESVRGELEGAILVAHAEVITFQGPLAKVGLGPYARLVSIGAYAGPREVLERRGRILSVGKRHPRFRLARWASGRAPTWVQVGDRVSPPLRDASRAVARDVPLYASREGLEWGG